ncbi:F0F1 ATP synthase subunit gamma [Sandaracinobacteroides sp. A072]|uniref:F0F1 ATP synthase subunit gamma n=1 Tax=Sandaracinobacteroides sp. A072 TaxID=3461146 RepID=UPI0040425262
MPSLKDLKVRIDSVKSTQKITKAMKMVAAAKLRRAQERAEQGRPYAQRMDAVIASLATKVKPGPQTSPLLAGTGRDQVHMLVVATAERGLCGGFNTNIVRAARRRADELVAQGKTVKLYLIGRKGRAVLIRTHRSAIVESVDLSGHKQVGFDVAQGIAADLIARFDAGEFDIATLFYSQFRSALVQEPTAQQIIPVKIPEVPAATTAGAVVEYEPDEEAILVDLLPRNVAVQLYRALLENAASEQGARMTAMDNATRNAGDMITRLTLTYNRTRQAAITKELIEIISGAEAL